MNTQLATQKYVKSFSTGQITVPKEFREALGLGTEFWLKMYLDENTIVAEPVIQESVDESYSKKLSKLKTDWFNESDYPEIRSILEERLLENDL
ncbi:MAG TPA: AbrB/MazE/SpoVT family DNA-binding domain-containing protein [candidate division WWE3 bacterium]|uniref:AbrB/MazE/SpoVT family DNA-binding domain-containing protein n=1 Tax=candidate division WWE3 bacterium TaxID=2053526 RepID=A0A7C1HD24_UNCKA|nr:AbrB/MazE/SpoVT family DNA-binding domain-containing protein [candidate division WWE3 bacterium]